MAITLKDIAAAAEVSISTASRALSGHSAIGEATVAKVQQIAAEMRYEPRRSRTPGSIGALADATIGVLSLGMDRTLVALPAIASALNGAEGELSRCGAHVQLAHIPDLSQPPRSLIRERVDGLILTGALQGDWIARYDGDFLNDLRGCPTVWLVGRPSGCWGDAVVANDCQVGAKAAEYLIAQGHRHLAFVNPKPDHLLFMRREDGFVAAAGRLGIEVQRFCEAPAGGWELPLQPPLAVETVQALVDRVLASTPRPTAIFAAADSVATLVYRALAVRELRAGQDMSVISGNNDHALIAGLHPALTTFDIHAHEIGRLAVRHLAARIQDSSPRPDCEVMLDTTLVEGDSVSSIPATPEPTT